MTSQLGLQIVVAVTGVVALVVTILFRVYSENRKGLGYEVLEVKPLLKKKDGADRLEIRFDGRVVEDPRMVRVRLCNAGQRMIREKDFKKPITISFGSTDAFEFTEPRCTPASLKPRLIYDPHHITIPALDLNRDAEIELTVLVSRELNTEDIECHTMIDDAINGGDARRLNVGPPEAVAMFGTVLLWTVRIVFGGGGVALLVWLFMDDLFKNGVVDGLKSIGVLLGMFGGMLIVGKALRVLFDRRRWPDSLR